MSKTASFITAIALAAVLFLSRACALTDTPEPGTDRYGWQASYADEYSPERYEPAYIETTVPETTADASQPRLMVTEYKIGSEYVTPENKTRLTIVIGNMSGSKRVSNIRLALSEQGGAVRADGTGTKYVDSIAPGGRYTWELDIFASKSAEIGEHTLTLSMEYEDKYYNSFSASDELIVTVRQPADIAYGGIALPDTVVQDGTETVNINLANSGKTALKNCRIDFDVEGLETSGSLFVGEIPVGETKTVSANLRVSGGRLGEVTGRAVIYYEDEYGEVLSEAESLATFIEKREELTGTFDDANETDKKGKAARWIFLTVGVIAGGAAGAGICAGIFSRKQRIRDEQML